MEICEVCDRPFRQLNLNHLRTHGIMTWDQYSEAVARRTKPDQTLIRDVAHGLLHKQEVEEGLKQRLARLQAEALAQAPAINAAAKIRMGLRRIALMDKLEKIEGLVFDEEKAAEYSFEQLVELAKLFGADIVAITKLLEDDGKKDGGNSSFPDNVSQVVQNQYNFVTAEGKPTQFDSRLPDDPRAEAGLLQQVEHMMGRMRQGEQLVLDTDGKVINVDHGNSGSTTDATPGNG